MAMIAESRGPMIALLTWMQREHPRGIVFARKGYVWDGEKEVTVLVESTLDGLEIVDIAWQFINYMRGAENCD